MLNPRRRIMPLTRVRTPGWSSTTAVRTRSLDSPPALSLWMPSGVLIRQLPEVVQASAQRHYRIDVGLGIDAEVDQYRSRRPLRQVESRLDLLHRLDADAGQPVSLGQLHEVRHLGQIDLGADTAVEIVLELTHHAQREAVQDRHLHVHPITDSHGQLLRRYEKAGFAGVAPARLLGPRHLGPDCSREREAHGPRAARVDEEPRPGVVPPERGPDLVLADVRDD